MHGEAFYIGTCIEKDGKCDDDWKMKLGYTRNKQLYTVDAPLDTKIIDLIEEVKRLGYTPYKPVLRTKK